ncbi:PqiC family protein [Paraburkholderia hospita]|uniref:ABC-type transport auxiliary lipoprotein component domain-containing protein n=2 Tax=Paraburkholderia hospita TaxID=169430 RepID=A0AAN1JER4_9BURK|nr:PqiC family protein [Paraburkholderia hospita]AUT71899.1 hypothetical protein C2L64_27080 [Paraburkholderia hospita]EIN02442.1 hypothetical protein WQE_03907 [Paraburkholderia hospita]OUL85290.1 hypothetical protein CA602_18470 [Paraburkholderia hospita]SEI25713.1 hypothetical protein SAMN05192544_106122 [Paraburkholderia hospita]
MKRLSLCLAVALTMITLVGCASSKSEFYTLSAEAPRESVNHGSPVTVVIGAVNVPELVNRPQIVVRAGTNHVTIDEFARWAEPLKSQIPRVFVADLSQLLNSPRVSTLPIGGDAAAAWRVRIDVQSFDASLGDTASVDVLWSVLPPGNAPPITGRTIASEPCAGAGYDAVVVAWSRALATVSRAIAAGIRTPGAVD